MDLVNIEVRAVIKARGYCDFIERNHLPYNLDLAPSEDYLFRNLKKIGAPTIFN